MKVIEQGKFVTSVIRCPHCEALLEFDKRDINICQYYSYYLYSIICPECDKTIQLQPNTFDGEECGSYSIKKDF